MTFAMNGALTIKTRDGANIEMAEAAGEDNRSLFGLTANQVVESREWYNFWWQYENQPDTRAALDLVFSDCLHRGQPDVFAPLRGILLSNSDFYMHLADLHPYLDADRRLMDLYAQPEEWKRNAILSVASSGTFRATRRSMNTPRTYGQ